MALLMSELSIYRPRRLGVRVTRYAVFSELAEALIHAMTGHWRPIGLTTGRMSEAMFTEQIVFDRESIRFVAPGQVWHAASLSQPWRALRRCSQRREIGCQWRIRSRQISGEFGGKRRCSLFNRQLRRQIPLGGSVMIYIVRAALIYHREGGYVQLRPILTVAGQQRHAELHRPVPASRSEGAVDRAGEALARRRRFPVAPRDDDVHAGQSDQRSRNAGHLIQVRAGRLT